MENFEINISNHNENIPVRTVWGKNRNKFLLFVGGSGDTKDTFENITQKLIASGLEQSVASFSFRGYESRKLLPLSQQVDDLEEVVSYLITTKNVKSLDMVCTSSGAYSTSFLLASKKFNNFIKEVIFVDPADYYVKDAGKPDEPYAWTGIEIYKPESKVASDMMMKIKSEARVHVVNFLLRNYGKDGYAPKKMRGEDNPKLYSRLNNDMVKAFYDKTPKKNRGKYLEVKNIPHAFERDGDIEKNEENVVQIILKCLR